LPTTTEKRFSLTDQGFVPTNLGEEFFHNLDTGGEEYRHAFVEEKIRSGLAAQIKTIREHLSMNQSEFAKLLGKSQSWVSRLEDANEAIPIIPTLLLIAKKLDIGLKVSFVRFSELLDDMSRLSPEALNVPSFCHDPRLFPRGGQNPTANRSGYLPSRDSGILHMGSENVVSVSSIPPARPTEHRKTFNVFQKAA